MCRLFKIPGFSGRRFFNHLVPTPFFRNTAPPRKLKSRTHTILPDTQASDSPHNVFLTLCIVSGKVEDPKCSCVAGFLGYCNHSLALMLKVCKFSLYGSPPQKKALENESDQFPDQPCTSKLQTWHQKGSGEKLSTPRLSWMLLFQKPNSRILHGETNEFILSVTRQGVM